MSALIEEVRQARRFRPQLARAVREAAGVSQQRLADELVEGQRVKTGRQAVAALARREESPR